MPTVLTKFVSLTVTKDSEPCFQIIDTGLYPGQFNPFHIFLFYLSELYFILLSLATDISF
jgi:hypothetical protein